MVRTVRPSTATASLAWLSLAAIAGEAVQHEVEYYFGMYVRGDGIAPGFETHVRWAAAAVKVAGFLATVIWTRRSSGRPLRATVLVLSIALAIILHYRLNYAAVGRPADQVVLLIAIDCLVVGAVAVAIGLLGRHRADRI